MDIELSRPHLLPQSSSQSVGTVEVPPCRLEKSQNSGTVSCSNLSVETASANGSQDNVPLISPRKVFDSVENGHGFGSATKLSGVFNLSTTIVGAGIMALPATMKVLGVPLGLTVIAVMGWLSEASIDLIIRTSTPRQAWSYGELVAGAYGRTAKLALQLAILCNNVGICIAYLIIIADVLSGTVAGSGDRHMGLLEEWAGGGNFWTSRAVVLFITYVFVLFPLVAQKHVESLQFTSAVSIALAILYLVITIAVFLVKLVGGQIGTPRMLPDVSSSAAILKLCSIIPVMSNAFICHFNVHPIWVEMKDRSESAIRQVAKTSLILCTSLYLAAALSGYLLFGEETSSDILANFDADLNLSGSRSLTVVVRIGYALHVVLVFPLVHFALRENVDNLVFPEAGPLVGDTRRFWATTGVLMGAIFVGAAVVPNIWIAFQFTGATSAVAIGFLFPALVALRDKSGAIYPTERLLARSMLVLAVAVSVTGVFSSVVGLIGG